MKKISTNEEPDSSLCLPVKSEGFLAQKKTDAGGKPNAAGSQKQTKYKIDATILGNRDKNAKTCYKCVSANSARKKVKSQNFILTDPKVPLASSRREVTLKSVSPNCNNQQLPYSTVRVADFSSVGKFRKSASTLPVSYPISQAQENYVKFQKLKQAAGTGSPALLHRKPKVPSKHRAICNERMVSNASQGKKSVKKTKPSVQNKSPTVSNECKVITKKIEPSTRLDSYCTPNSDGYQTAEEKMNFKKANDLDTHFGVFYADAWPKIRLPANLTLQKKSKANKVENVQLHSSLKDMSCTKKLHRGQVGKVVESKKEKSRLVEDSCKDWNDSTALKVGTSLKSVMSTSEKDRLIRSLLFKFHCGIKLKSDLGDGVQSNKSTPQQSKPIVRYSRGDVSADRGKGLPDAKKKMHLWGSPITSVKKSNVKFMVQGFLEPKTA